VRKRDVKSRVIIPASRGNRIEGRDGRSAPLETQLVHVGTPDDTAAWARAIGAAGNSNQRQMFGISTPT
jgi:hypothetical protein